MYFRAVLFQWHGHYHLGCPRWTREWSPPRAAEASHPNLGVQDPRRALWAHVRACTWVLPHSQRHRCGRKQACISVSCPIMKNLILALHQDPNCGIIFRSCKPLTRLRRVEKRLRYLHRLHSPQCHTSPLMLLPAHPAGMVRPSRAFPHCLQNPLLCPSPQR